MITFLILFLNKNNLKNKDTLESFSPMFTDYKESFYIFGVILLLKKLLIGFLISFINLKDQITGNI
jgi:hypothetical protein